MFQVISRNEIVSFSTHLGGFILSIAGFIFLAIKSRDLAEISIPMLIYGFSVTFLFASSSLYHYMKKEEDSTSIYRRLDHFAIFIMIAGTYTPFCHLYLHGYVKWTILGIQWGLVLLGLILKIFFIKSPRWLTTLIYLLMGWTVIVPIKEFISNAPHTVMLLIAAGGFLYTLGALVYAKKKPDPVPGVFGFHEIFHVFILIAAILHYAAVVTAIG